MELPTASKGLMLAIEIDDRVSPAEETVEPIAVRLFAILRVNSLLSDKEGKLRLTSKLRTLRPSWVEFMACWALNRALSAFVR